MGLKPTLFTKLVVKQTLQTSEDEDIYAIGDCAACKVNRNSDKHVPPRAQAAHQMATLSLQIY